MYRKIMVPVDLAHLDQLEKALTTAARLAKDYAIPITYVSVTSSAPGSIAHTPDEYAKKLDAFAAAQASAHGVNASAKTYTSHDPSIDLDGTLQTAVTELDADLVVMASHVPNLTDYLWPSHGGRLATHSEASVFVVR